MGANRPSYIRQWGSSWAYGGNPRHHFSQGNEAPATGGYSPVPVTTILYHGTETSCMLFLLLEGCLYSYLPRESLVIPQSSSLLPQRNFLSSRRQITLPLIQVPTQCVHPHQPLLEKPVLYICISTSSETSWKQNHIHHLCIPHRGSTEFNVCLMNKQFKVEAMAVLAPSQNSRWILTKLMGK